MTDSLDQVAALLRRETGIQLEQSQHSALRSALARASPDGNAKASSARPRIRCGGGTRSRGS